MFFSWQSIRRRIQNEFQIFSRSTVVHINNQDNEGAKQMKCKVWTILAVVISIWLPLTAAFAADYSDAVKVNEQFVAAMEQYVEELTSANSGPTVAAAFNNYTDVMEKLVPQLKAMKEKYPELGSGELPEVMKPLAERAEQLGGKMAGAMMNIVPFMGDPSVQAAQQRMAQVMGNME